MLQIKKIKKEKAAGPATNRDLIKALKKLPKDAKVSVCGLEPEALAIAYGVEDNIIYMDDRIYIMETMERGIK